MLDNEENAKNLDDMTSDEINELFSDIIEVVDPMLISKCYCTFSSYTECGARL